MSRYIDADALIEYLKKMWGKWEEDDWYEAQAKDAMKDDIEIVNKQPTVDAVPVVRCAECKWFAEFCDDYKQKSRKDGMCEQPTLDRYAFATTFDFYCADGERRTE